MAMTVLTKLMCNTPLARGLRISHLAKTALGICSFRRKYGWFHDPEP